METEKLKLELESLVEKSGYTIRKERGTFSGNYCIMEGDKLVVINTKRPPEQQVGILFKVLKKTGVNDIYVKPAVRKELEELNSRFEQFEEENAKPKESPQK